MEQEASTTKSSVRLTESLRVADLFSLTATQSSDLPKSSLRVEDFPDLRKSVPRLVSWTSVQSAIAGSLGKALDVPVIDVFADAWKSYDALRKDINESIESPRSEVVSALFDHEIASTFHPTVDVLVGKARVCELVFDVTLTAVVKGLLITLVNGAITAIEWGSCSGSGAIATHKIKLIERTLFDLKLPGQLSLEKPIALSANL